MVLLYPIRTYAHALDERRAHAPQVTSVVTASITSPLSRFRLAYPFCCPNRPWDIESNPWVAVEDYVRERDYFEVAEIIAQKSLATVAPGMGPKGITGDPKGSVQD